MPNFGNIFRQGDQIEATLQALFGISEVKQEGSSIHLEKEICETEAKILSILLSQENECIPPHDIIEYKTLLAARFHLRDKLIRILIREGNFENAKEKVRDFKIQNFYTPTSWNTPSLPIEQKHWQSLEDAISKIIEKK